MVTKWHIDTGRVQPYWARIYNDRLDVALCCAGFTVTVAVPDLLVSWVEVAVIVTCSDVTPPDGAVNKPEVEIVPALAVPTSHPN